MRHQILDSTPQKDRAALSQSKGLQNRRLPKNLVNKVPEDYSEQRRRANTFAVGGARRAASHSPVRQPEKIMEDTESVDGGEIISEEERRQRVRRNSGQLVGRCSVTNPNVGIQRYGNWYLNYENSITPHDNYIMVRTFWWFG